VGADLIGWAASIILLATLGRQVYSQWQSGQTEGVSRWLFIGQVTASVGFSLYSWLLHNWVFLFTNIAILCTAVAGEWIYLRNRRRARGAPATTRSGTPAMDAAAP
jgi:MtN3 and saliva related transmembrane protein